MYKNATQILLGLLFSYSVYTLGINIITFLILICFILSFLSGQLNGIIKKIYFALSLPLNLIAGIVLILLTININIDFGDKKSIFNSKYTEETKRNYIMLYEKLDKGTELLKSEYRNDLLTVIREKTYSFDETKIYSRLREGKNNQWLNFIRTYKYEIDEIKKMISLGQIDESRNKIRILMDSVLKILTNQIDIEGNICTYSTIKIIIKFYIENKGTLNMDEEVITWIREVDKNIEIGYRNGIINDFKFSQYLVENPELNFESLTQTGKKENLEIFTKYPMYNKTATRKDLEGLYNDIFERYSNTKYYLVNNLEKNKKEDLGLRLSNAVINPIGKIVLFGIKNLLAEKRANELYLKKEKTLSLLSVTLSILKKEKLPLDRLSGKNYIIEKTTDKIKIKSEIKEDSKSIEIIEY